MDYLIKRYPNRKLYDTLRSKYVNLEKIAGLIRRGKPVKVVDHKTNQDATPIVLAEIILKQAREKRPLLRLPDSLSRLLMRKARERPAKAFDELDVVPKERYERLRKSVASLKAKINKLQVERRRFIQAARPTGRISGGN